MSEIDPKAILDCPMQANDAGASTVGKYLVELLSELWGRGEGFSGKRPFGNSGWESDIYAALVRGKLVDGTLDYDGYPNTVDEGHANLLVLQAIKSLYPKDHTT